MRPIALLSDFGLQDGFAGEVRATLYRLAPAAHCFDLSHGVPPGDIRAAAWMIASAWPHLPDDCILLCMVDPGHGNASQAILADSMGRILLAPDNGCVSLLARIFGAELKCIPFQNHSPFLGRDVLAPLAFTLCREEPLHSAGTTHAPLTHLPASAKEPILHVDYFGNVILDLHQSERHSEQAKWIAQWLHDHNLSEIPETGAESYHTMPGHALSLYWGSSGFLEIAHPQGSAAFQLGIKTQSPWT